MESCASNVRRDRISNQATVRRGLCIWPARAASSGSAFTQSAKRRLCGDEQHAPESKLDALRNAQLAVLNKNRAKYGDTLPATLGAFVLTGELE